SSKAFFFFFSLLELKSRSFQPDIVHCLDFHTGLIFFYLITEFLMDDFFRGTKSVFTIHNLAYQGLFSYEQFRQIDLSGRFGLFETLEFWGKASFMKAALIYSDWITTVSPGYCREIQTETFGCGLQDVLKLHSERLCGILNGIDTDEWNPESDALEQPFSAEDVQGKVINKKALAQSSGFDTGSEDPIIGMVTRLAEQKGFDLIREAFEELMSLPVRVVILGTGDPELEAFFQEMNGKYKEKFKAFLGFDAAQANRIYAGSDFFLMPSRFEPCGLGQMIAFRYGSLPIVHQTGGLADTVSDLSVNPDSGHGFVFSPYDSGLFMDAVRRALSSRKDTLNAELLIQRVMKLDFSWSRSAGAYEAMYQGVLKAPAIKVHENRSIVIGLTGLSGSGKSTVRQYFENRGAFTVDSDALVHQALRENAIQLRISQSLNIPMSDCEPQEFRQKIRKTVGAAPELLSKLESIIHPFVRVRLTAMIQQIKSNGGILIAEIPLLFETGMDSFFDQTIVVTRNQNEILSEAKARGWSQQESDALIGRQWTEADKCRKADHVIRNDGTLKNLELKIQTIYEQLKNGGLNL
ncbi:MAG: dephospho-CoA kinase, partial [Candidatus Omnitrophica bacterium]|nr:dephospho-CoA kinase [Candidatus Omnitrophota bacterium]